jgi:hypothetical protein
MSDDNSPTKKSWTVFLVMAVAGLMLYFGLGDRVFPSASIDLKLGRREVKTLAADLAKKYGYATEGTIQATTFTYFNEAKTFLEYELGINQANKLMLDKVPVWCWSSRFQKEFAYEQMRVWFSPQGQLMGFSHALEHERKLPTISHEEALKRAREFLARDAHLNLDNLVLKNDSSSSRANREDHSFTFEDKSVDYKEGRLRYDVSFSGDLLTDYSSYLKVPDSFVRKYENIRSYNNLLQSIAGIFYNTLQIIAYLVVPWAMTRRQLRYKLAIFGGILVAGIQALSSVNDYQMVLDSYDSSRSFQDYVTSYYLREVISTLGSFLSGAMTFGACDTVYRLVYPKRIALENFLSWRGFATKEGGNVVLLGSLLFAIHLGWIVLYYLLGEKLNFWCPLGVDQYQTLGSFVPALSALAIGVQAASTEETVARVVGLALLEKLTKRFWLANLLQAMAWGFMHSSYPQQPAYARGIELTITGMVYGYVMKRYGLLPCVISHYLLDAFLTAEPLFSSPELGLRLEGLVPLVVFLVMYGYGKVMSKLRGGVDAKNLINSALPMPDTAIKPVETVQEFNYKPFSKKAKWWLAAVGILSTVFCFVVTNPEPSDKSRLKLNREQAITRAREILDARGINVSDYQVTVSLSNSCDADEMQYICEKLGRKKAYEYAIKEGNNYIWSVRFFRFLDPTVYRMDLWGDGREQSLCIKKDDDTGEPGSSVSKVEAIRLATEYVHLVDPQFKDIKLDKVSVDEKKNRTDFTVDFLVPSMKVAEANYLVEVEVTGKFACNASQGWQIPQGWYFERNKQSHFKTIMSNVRFGLMAIMGLAFVIWAIGVLRSGALTLRIPIVTSLACLLLSCTEQINHLLVFFEGYSTSLSRETYIFNQLTDMVAGYSQGAIKTFGSLAFGLAAFKLLSPKVDVATVVRTTFKPVGIKDRLTQEKLWLDGILVALLWSGLVNAISTLSELCNYYFSPELHITSVWIICSLPDYLAPVASDLLALPQSVINQLMSAVIMAGLFAKYFPKAWIFIVACIPFQLLMASGARNVPDFAMGGIQSIATSLLYPLIVFKLARFNPVAYLVKIVFDDAMPYLWGIWVYAFPTMSADFFSLLIYCVSPLMIYAYLRVRNRKLKVANACTKDADANVNVAEGDGSEISGNGIGDGDSQASR